MIFNFLVLRDHEAILCLWTEQYFNDRRELVCLKEVSV